MQTAALRVLRMPAKQALLQLSAKYVQHAQRCLLITKQIESIVCFRTKDVLGMEHIPLGRRRKYVPTLYHVDQDIGFHCQPRDALVISPCDF